MNNLNPEVLVTIDGSYLIYYSLFGAFNKWKAKPENEMIIEHGDENNPPNLILHSDFVELFESHLVKRFESVFWIINTRIFKDICFTDTPDIYLCLDSPIKYNWRSQLFDQYKMQRKLIKHSFNVREAFRYGMNILLNKIDIENYFGIKTIKVHGAEGDDIIATMMTKIEAQYKYVIASDRDFLQLGGNIRIFDLTGKEILPPEFENQPVSPKKYLLSKILTGDDSDNIPQVFPRCGYKTAMKLVNSPVKLRERLSGDALAMAQFRLNEKLINFNNIPETLTESIMMEVK